MGLSSDQQSTIDSMNTQMQQSKNFMVAVSEMTQKQSAMTTAVKAYADEAQDTVKQRPQV